MAHRLSSVQTFTNWTCSATFTNPSNLISYVFHTDIFPRNVMLWDRLSHRCFPGHFSLDFFHAKDQYLFILLILITLNYQDFLFHLYRTLNHRNEVSEPENSRYYITFECLLGNLKNSEWGQGKTSTNRNFLIHEREFELVVNSRIKKKHQQNYGTK